MLEIHVTSHAADRAAQRLGPDHTLGLIRRQVQAAIAEQRMSKRIPAWAWRKRTRRPRNREPWLRFVWPPDRSCAYLIDRYTGGVCVLTVYLGVPSDPRRRVPRMATAADEAAANRAAASAPDTGPLEECVTILVQAAQQTGDDRFAQAADLASQGLQDLAGGSNVPAPGAAGAPMPPGVAA